MLSVVFFTLLAMSCSSLGMVQRNWADNYMHAISKFMKGIDDDLVNFHDDNCRMTINGELVSTTGKEAMKIFQGYKDSVRDYHVHWDGQQVADKWAKFDFHNFCTLPCENDNVGFSAFSLFLFPFSSNSTCIPPPLKTFDCCQKGVVWTYVYTTDILQVALFNFACVFRPVCIIY